MARCSVTKKSVCQSEETIRMAGAAKEQDFCSMAKFMLKHDEESLLRRGCMQAIEKKRPFAQPREKIAGHSDFCLSDEAEHASRIDEFSCRTGQP